MAARRRCCECVAQIRELARDQRAKLGRASQLVQAAPVRLTRAVARFSRWAYRWHVEQSCEGLTPYSFRTFAPYAARSPLGGDHSISVLRSTFGSRRCASG